ncbi:MAG: HD domain-containing protein [Solirubrobacteraceae bacterium]|nr:HD domain-containing protein [Solirubrobacteraceae bacterium]
MERRTDYDRAKLLVEAIQELSVTRTVEDVRSVVRSAARVIAGADGATFVLRDEGQCHYVDEDAISPLWKGLRFPLEACISGWTMLNKRPAVIPDIYADVRIPHDAYRPTFVTSLVMVPIRKGDPIGAIGTYWAKRHHATDEEVELLQALADSTAVAMENARMLLEIERARLETLTRLAFAAEFRDDDTFQHTQRVARTASLLSRELGLPESDTLLIRQAASLHDIGKLAVPDAILLKPGRLTTGEYDQMKEHAAIGAAMLEGSHSDALKLAGEIALTHHERWDGTGYPNRVAEHEIPLSGRIVAVADVFDSLTHVRPYKSAWSLQDAVGEIRSLRGAQFDPTVVEAFEGLPAASLIDGDFGTELKLVA